MKKIYILLIATTIYELSNAQERRSSINFSADCNSLDRPEQNRLRSITDDNSYVVSEDIQCCLICQKPWDDITPNDFNEHIHGGCLTTPTLFSEKDDSLADYFAPRQPESLSLSAPRQNIRSSINTDCLKLTNNIEDDCLKYFCNIPLEPPSDDINDKCLATINSTSTDTEIPSSSNDSRVNSSKKNQCNNFKNQYFKCDICLHTFKNKQQLLKHIITHSNPALITCTKCVPDHKFANRDSYRVHMLRIHQVIILPQKNQRRKLEH